MKKINKKGFTLIELLAVIVIMGILMMVAIPAMQKYIENSKKDVFVQTAKQYATAVKNMWASGSIYCNNGSIISSSTIDYTNNTNWLIPISTFQSDTTLEGYDFLPNLNPYNNAQKLLTSGGKSPWGNKNIRGYVIVTHGANDISVFMTDGTYGIKKSGTNKGQNIKTLSRSDILNNVKFDGYSLPMGGAGDYMCWVE